MSLSSISSEEEDWSWPTNSRSAQERYLKRLRLAPDQVVANRSALGKVVNVCHQVARCNVRRVTTCGSVGKRTASSHSADLDLVVFVEDLRRDDKLSNQFFALLDAIQEAMDSQYPGTRDENWYRKFGLRYVIAGMEIDILLAIPDVHPRDFLEVSNPEQRAFMSASVSHLATRFIKKQNLLFKDLVRVAKDWRDSFTWAPQCKPKSYLLEVIMLAAFRRSKVSTTWRSSYAMWRATDILLKFFDLIGSVEEYSPSRQYDASSLPPLFVCFETYYSKDDLPLTEPEPLFQVTRIVGKGKRVQVKTRKATAIVMDPANPTNNLWLTLGDAQTLVSRAKNAAEEIRGNQ
jgi:hypothetical protein